ncbi:MAG: hypothetical protein M3Y72_09830 [Acidobacteriota bacterium]|nr:hypothetical protein [Acidobacteriota bacterium]
MIIAIALAIVIAALYFTLGIRDKDIPELIPVSPIQHLDDRKQAIYDNLRDLQFEYRLGKLSDGDYQQNKQALQRELAGVLAEREETIARLGLLPVKPARPVQRSAPSAGFACSHCGAKFSQSLKFCGECGKATG